VEEAASYYGIGIKKLYDIIHTHQGADFILEIGSHSRIKRKLFERFLDDVTSL
ncbi:MAG: helix-turn-helix domain-containing protein, partial [Lachnospiraceae bacterium]|nr:helix-turn-helix domain-containing protein [Lachnospiraceae bacterium]